MADHQPTALDEYGGPRLSRPALAGVDLLLRLAVARPVRSGVLARVEHAEQLRREFLGEPPALCVDGTCSMCGFPPVLHVTPDGERLSIRDWHRRDVHRPNAFYADEMECAR